MPEEFIEFKFNIDYDKNHKEDYESHLSAIRRIIRNYKELNRYCRSNTLYFTGDSVLKLSYDSNLPSGNSGSAAISQAMDKLKAWISLNVISKKGTKPRIVEDLEKLLEVVPEVKDYK